MAWSRQASSRSAFPAIHCVVLPHGRIESGRGEGLGREHSGQHPMQGKGRGEAEAAAVGKRVLWQEPHLAARPGKDQGRAGAARLECPVCVALECCTLDNVSLPLKDLLIFK